MKVLIIKNGEEWWYLTDAQEERLLEARLIVYCASCSCNTDGDAIYHLTGSVKSVGEELKPKNNYV